MNLKLLVSLISILLLSACGITENGSVASNKEAVTATKTSQIKPTLTSTLEPASTETPTLPPTNTLPPTFTFTPSPTSTSTATVTPSPTPIPIAIVEVSLANIYSGVAIYAPVVAVFAEDTALKILGITPDDSWLLVEIAPEQNGWVQKKAIHLEYQVPIPTIDPPPPPTLTPTAVKLPSISVHLSKDSFILEFFNFQPGEQLNYSLYKYDVRVARGFVPTGSQGYAKRTFSRLKLSQGANYRLVVSGVHGSYVEKSFTP